MRGPNLQQNETTLLIQKLEPGTFTFLPGGLDIFQTNWKVFRWPGKFPDGLYGLQTAWKVYRPHGKFSDGLYTVQSPDGLESFQMACKVSRWPRQSPDGLDSLQSIHPKSGWPGSPDSANYLNFPQNYSLRTRELPTLLC